MATLYGTQAKLMFGQSVAGVYEQAKGSEARGKVRVMVFDRTGTQVIAQNDLVVLGRLPKGYRVLGGRLTRSAHGAAVTLDIGTYTMDVNGNLTVVTENAFLSALDISAAGEADFANTATLGFLGAASTAEHVIAGKYEGGNPTDDATISGWLKYIAPDN